MWGPKQIRGPFKVQKYVDTDLLRVTPGRGAAPSRISFPTAINNSKPFIDEPQLLNGCTYCIDHKANSTVNSPQTTLNTLLYYTNLVYTFLNPSLIF